MMRENTIIMVIRLIKRGHLEEIAMIEILLVKEMVDHVSLHFLALKYL
jgi:hypothetical protein